MEMWRRDIGRQEGGRTDGQQDKKEGMNECAEGTRQAEG